MFRRGKETAALSARPWARTARARALWGLTLAALLAMAAAAVAAPTPAAASSTAAAPPPGGGAPAAARAAATADARSDEWISPISLHSQTYACCMPFELKEKVVREAVDLGAGFLRVDIYLDALFDEGGRRRATPDFSGIDEMIWLARRYHVRLLAIMVGTPGYLSTCPQWGERSWFKCPPRDVGEYGRLVAAVVARAPDVFRYVEIGNEPDGDWVFAGSPSDYAAMVRSAAGAVKAAFPQTKIVLAAPMTAGGGMPWFDGVFAALGGARPFDVVNAHVREPLERVRTAVLRWRRYYSDHGLGGLPLWLTEFAYPADPRWQVPPYNGGERSQAAYYERAIPLALRAGADQVFVTLRDGYLHEQDERFLSEGMVTLDITRAPYALRRKPAFATVKALVARFRREWESSRALAAARAARTARAAQAARARRSMRGRGAAHRATGRRLRRDACARCRTRGRAHPVKHRRARSRPKQNASTARGCAPPHRGCGARRGRRSAPRRD